MAKLLNKKVLIIIIFVVIMAILFGPLKIQDKILKLIYPKKYEEYVEKYSLQYGVDQNLIFAIIKAESNFNENATSSKGAKGLMQLMPNTASEIATQIDINLTEEELNEKLTKPELNINLGTKYVSLLLEKYNNSIELTLTAYNAGSGNVDNWIENGIIKQDGSDIENVPYKETNNYVRKILRDYDIYEKIY